MYKPISRQAHGLVTDYPYVLWVAASPWLFGFTEDVTPARLTMVFAGLILVTSLFTRAEWGLFRVLPYKMHLVADVTVGLFALSMPWLFGFAEDVAARYTFLVMGVFSLIAGFFSQTNEMPAYAGAHLESVGSTR